MAGGTVIPKVVARLRARHRDQGRPLARSHGDIGWRLDEQERASVARNPELVAGAVKQIGPLRGTGWGGR